MTIVLSWLIGNPRRFKIYVSNRVSSIVEHIPPDDWNHVNGVENPADHVSRGLFPSQLLNCRVWWEGPPWLKLPSFQWPQQSRFSSSNSDEEREICHLTLTPSQTSCLLPLNPFQDSSEILGVGGREQHLHHSQLTLSYFMGNVLFQE